jgi:hypothetical protein
VAIVASMSPCSLSYSSIEASNLAIVASYSSIEASNLAIVASTSPCSLSCWSIEASIVAIAASSGDSSAELAWALPFLRARRKQGCGARLRGAPGMGTCRVQSVDRLVPHDV